MYATAMAKAFGDKYTVAAEQRGRRLAERRRWRGEAAERVCLVLQKCKEILLPEDLNRKLLRYRSTAGGGLKRDSNGGWFGGFVERRWSGKQRVSWSVVVVAFSDESLKT
jgi:hypothetical protein